ncbi:MAG TPA: hypothetical protein VFZ89_04600 [Solirubrobacteraceae bacterium]
MIRVVGRFLADFIIGDDWRIAAGVVTVLAVGALLVSQTGLGDNLITPLLALGFVGAAALTLRD